MKRRLTGQRSITSFFKSSSTDISKQSDHQLDVGLESNSSSGRRRVGFNQVEGPCSSQQLFSLHFEYDIADYQRGAKVEDQIKFNYLAGHWRPDLYFKFPAKEYLYRHDKKFLKFHRSWLQTFRWLAYSPSQDGAYCVCCRLFAGDVAGGQQLRQFVTEPMQNWKVATAKCRSHAQKEYHIMALLRADDFERAHKKGTIVERWDSRYKKKAIANREAITAIIEAIIFCGRENISLRGHRDSGPMGSDADKQSRNEGHFRALLRFAMTSGNKHLADHFATAAANAKYDSPTIQNEIVEICGNLIRKDIVERVAAAKYFSVLADETSDVAQLEQFSLSVRYVHVDKNMNGCVREDFLGFVEAKVLTGRALANLLIQTLTSWNIELSNMRGQGYDGAANMSGCFNGVQALVREKFPAATYTHCSSHCLNLVLSHACGNAAIRRAISSIREVIVFFTKSPKRKKILKDAIEAICPDSRKTKLTTLCETRWVERHDAVTVFLEVYSAIVHALGEIENGDDNASTKASAVQFQQRIQTMEFLLCLHMLVTVLVTTRSLAVELQSKDMDLIKCAEIVSNVVDTFKEMLANAEDKFSSIFEKVLSVVRDHEIPMVVRGLRVRNASELDIKNHALENTFRPFIQNVIKEIEERFGNTFHRAAQCFAILPLKINAGSCPGTSDSDVFKLYEDDLDSWVTLQPELEAWRRKWRNADLASIPTNALSAFNAAPEHVFPNIRRLLQILVTLPKTTASAERSFSALRTLKNYLRSNTGEDRMNGLALMQIHRDIELSKSVVLREFVNKSARRLKIAMCCE